jgi:O-acetyl-ADP-ribose deacetylase (regulator of RNase III)
MIERTRGNLLDAPAEALVNTVNTVGIMGKGIALQFKKIYPQNYEAYRKACEASEVEIGRMFTVDLGTLDGPRFIINFPTKLHWRGKSKIEDIEAGLQALVAEVRRLGLRSIALPALGCGNGGLDWAEVLPLIEKALNDLSDVHVYLYEPSGAPAPAKVKANAKRPKMTIARAVILSLINRYLAACLDPFATLLEIHKLAYCAQSAGEALKLGFEEGPYGPYADNLRHVLNHMEGHFIRGVGDGRTQPDTQIDLLPGAAAEAEAFLEDHSLTQERFARVAELIEGFETPFGMELLASVHWVVVQKDQRAKDDLPTAVAVLRGWNDRKARLFDEREIEAAWTRLKTLGWF